VSENFLLEVKPMSLAASLALSANQLDRILAALQAQKDQLSVLVQLTNQIRLLLEAQSGVGFAATKSHQ